MEKMLENLTGTVEDITFFNEENGFTVMEITAADGETVTVVGTFPRMVEGEEVLLSGEWGIHPSFGRQFKASLVERTMPADTAGILRYLASGIIKGVREATAVKIVEAFGSESLEVIENDVNRLASVPGISKPKARKIQEEYKKQFAAREVMTGLTALGLTQDEAFKAYNMYRSAALEIISENPYAFVGANGYSFDRAEEISLNMQTPPLFDYRSQAMVVYVVNYNLRNGHTCVPRNSVVKRAKDYLECNEDAVEEAIDTALDAKQLFSENIDGKDYLFMPEIYHAEKDVADRIKVMVNYPPQQSEISPSEVYAFEKANDIEFDEKQRQAIEIAVNKGMLILTGGPGTGKTTTVKGIITLMKNRGFNVALAAPTGRASKRMTELTGYDSKTIHRLLEVEYREGATEPTFVYNRKNPLDVDAVIVDELSMVDITIFNSLLDALPLHARLIMVGDKDQLPPVGAGNVLKDLTDSGMIPVVALDKVFRQAMQRRLPATYGYNSMTDIEVLCPSRKGEVGCENINILLQEKLNPPDRSKKELRNKGYILREGDKVMQIKNNYDVPWFKSSENGTGVFNGDIGILTKIDRANDILNVKFDDREAMYSLENANELELAYAMTVHKSQGSEFDAVVMPVLATPPKLAYRNLFYTALTRAKNLLVLVGNESSVKAMVDNDKKSRRYSALNHFLTVDNDEFIQ